jgi:DNA-binding Xre family transcriptional regulator
MGKGRMVNDKIIDRICEYLKCQPRDIIEIE